MYCIQELSRTVKSDFKGAWSYFSKYSFMIPFDELSLHCCKFKISVKTVKLFGCMKQFCILQLPTSYGIHNHAGIYIFINIFHTEHFSTWNLPWVMKKIWAFLWYLALKKSWDVFSSILWLTPSDKCWRQAKLILTRGFTVTGFRDH